MNTKKVADGWPQLSQKVLIDFINGTEVAGELVRVRAERRGLLARAAVAITGRGAAENHVIQAALVDGQLTTISWLESLQARQADSDLALAKVAIALKAHRDRTLARDADVDARFVRIEQTLQYLYQQQAQVRAQLDVRNELEWALNDARGLEDVSALGRAFYVVDRLWWGPFGAFVRGPSDGQADKVERYVREAQQKIAERLSQDLGLPRSSLVDVNALVREFQASEGPDAETIRYLADGGETALSPLHSLLARRDAGTPALTLPRQSSVDRIATRLWSEARWTAQRRINDED